MPSKRNGNGRASLAEWRGGVTVTLDALVKQVGELGPKFEAALSKHADEDHASFKDVHEKIETVDKAQIALATKVAIYSGLAGSAVAGVMHYFLKALGA